MLPVALWKVVDSYATPEIAFEEVDNFMHYLINRNKQKNRDVHVEQKCERKHTKRAAQTLVQHALRTFDSLRSFFERG